MKNKKLFLFSLPILLPIVTILVLLWINYFSDTFVHANEKAISSVFGVLMMILGFYISIVLFIATDDKEKVEFIELLINDKVPISNLRKLPEELTKIPPQCLSIRLGGCKAFKLGKEFEEK